MRHLETLSAEDIRAVRIVEDDSQDAFFGNPRSERARQFLDKILQH